MTHVHRGLPKAIAPQKEYSQELPVFDKIQTRNLFFRIRYA
jgi:hypothetical protein